jgi:hypothetical protein
LKKYLSTETNITNKSDGSQIMKQPKYVFKLNINKNNINLMIIKMKEILFIIINNLLKIKYFSKYQ